MASSNALINSTYCLAKVNGQMRLCRFSQNNIIHVDSDGTVTKVCTKKDKTLWKYFVESIMYMSRVQFEVGGKVLKNDDEGKRRQYYIVDAGSADEEGFIKYTLAR